MGDQFASALRLLPDYLTQHILLSASAIGVALAICAPLVVIAVARPRLAAILLASAGVVQTIPSLALMALFFHILLGLSAVTHSLASFNVPAFGFLPALLPLTLYAMLPILRAGVTGLQQIDPDLIEAAKGVGMTPRQSMLRVEMPLAAPILVGGLRTACVWTIGAATLATPIGQTSLGNYVFSGLQTENWIFVIVGCVAAALLALTVDALLALLERGIATRRRRPVWVSCSLVAAIVALSFLPGLRAAGSAYVIGAKNFSEQYILAELMRQRIATEGARAILREGLGSAVVYRALSNNDIDAYVDYAGTLWTNVLNRKDRPPRSEMIATLTHELRARDGVRVLGTLGFENAYALVMRKDRAAALGIHDINDLARAAPQLVLGADLEFLQRPEWASLRDTYDLRFREQRSFNPTFIYQALEAGEVDVISGFSSDGRITRDRHLVLDDPKRAIPAYDALILLAPKRQSDATLIHAFQPLIDSISPQEMRSANLEVDRGEDKQTPAQAARDLARSLKSR